jgi:ribonuclease I
MLIANLNMVNTESIYNYYELAVQKWCSDDYMIHGLWPQINSTDYPVNCKPVLYIEPEGTLLINMNTYWSSCDNTLWEHEWEKHGSCMQVQNNINETSFFNKTISLFIENKKLLENCKDDDCIMGCFDLDYNLINC